MDVPALNVNPAVIERSIGKEEEVSVTVDALKLIVLVPAAVEKPPTDKANPPVLNVPLVNNIF